MSEDRSDAEDKLYEEGYNDGYREGRADAAKQERERVLKEPRDCATCNNKQNAEKYVKRMAACSMRVHRKKVMDDHKECCPEKCSMGTVRDKFEFNPDSCRGYSGACRKDGCSNFRWWHAKCYCPIIREYDTQQKKLRASTGKGGEQG